MAKVTNNVGIKKFLHSFLLSNCRLYRYLCYFLYKITICGVRNAGFSSPPM